MPDLALEGGTVHVSPADEPLRDAVVLIEGSRIAAVAARADVPVPRSVRTLDCSGLTVTAGFWNSHVHLFERKWEDAASLPGDELRRQLEDAFTRYGFTSVFDLSSSFENTRRLRDRIASREIPGPRILSTGEGLLPPGAVPSDAVLGVLGMTRAPLPEIADAAQAGASARKLLDQGVDGVKLFASSPSGTSLAEGAIEAAAREAHRAGKPVFVHPNTGADVLAALRGGADVVAHTTPRSGSWDAAVLAAARERGAALTPTLALWRHFLRHDRRSLQDRVLATAVAQLREWVAAGAEVLFGTDLGAVDPDPSPEYELMARGGMGFREVLAALTTAPADRFAPGQLGRVAAGYQADLVVLEGDPSADVQALASVRLVVRGGATA